VTVELKLNACIRVTLVVDASGTVVVVYKVVVMSVEVVDVSGGMNSVVEVVDVRVSYFGLDDIVL